jgi:hypothetical protein
MVKISPNRRTSRERAAKPRRSASANAALQPAFAHLAPRLIVHDRPVAELAPYANNARTHSPRQIAKIAASIQAFGFVNPILIDADSGVVAGHGRLEAAKQLGMETVPTIRLDHLSEAALESRQETIGEHYEARRQPPEAARAMGAAPYRPLPPDQLYLSERTLGGLLEGRNGSGRRTAIRRRGQEGGEA